MKKKIILSTLFLAIFFLGYSQFSDNAPQTPLNVMNNSDHFEKKLIKDDLSSSALSAPTPIAADKGIIQEEKSIETDLSKPENLVSLIQGAYNESGKEYDYHKVNVYNVDNNGEYYYILVSKDRETGVVTAIATYKDYSNDGDFELGTVSGVKENNWSHYPPVTLSDAIDIVSNKFSNSDYELLYNDLAYIGDSKESYIFNVDDEIYLVGAEIGGVHKYEPQKDTKDDMNDLAYLENGLLRIRDGVSEKLSRTEYDSFVKITEESNQMILDGKLIFNSSDLNDYTLVEQ